MHKPIIENDGEYIQSKYKNFEGINEGKVHEEKPETQQKVIWNVINECAKISFKYLGKVV